MGFGIAALGNAVGAATKGYMEGSRFRSEMEDAEARRGLIKLQSEEAGLKLGRRVPLDALVVRRLVGKPAHAPASRGAGHGATMLRFTLITRWLP